MNFTVISPYIFLFPVHGSWSDWMPWSLCTVSCGFGRQYRNRICNAPKPAYGGDDCPFFVPTDYIEGCNPYPCPSKFVSTFWSPVLRLVLMFDLPLLHQYWFRYPREMPEIFEDFEAWKNFCYMFLHLVTCIIFKPSFSRSFSLVHGSWGEWLEVEVCTQPCGMGGTKRQRRYCDDPAPIHGGRGCAGSNERMKKCNEEKPCESKFFLYIMLSLWFLIYPCLKRRKWLDLYTGKECMQPSISWGAWIPPTLKIN